MKKRKLFFLGARQGGAPTRFLTFGHSIENYSFVAECIKGYLRFAFFEFVTGDIEKRVDDLFFSAVCLSVALSEEVRSMEVIGRFNGIIRPEFISLYGEKFTLISDIEPEIQSRGISSTGFIARVNQRVDDYFTSGKTVQELKWLSHGHIGEHTLWSAVAKIFESHGCPPQVINEVAFGNKEMRSKFWSDWLAQQGREAREPLDELLDKVSS